MAPARDESRCGSRRHRYERRCRGMLAWLACSFITAQLVAGLWFDYVQPRVKFAHLYRQLDQLERLPKPPDIICLGSSRFGTCLLDHEMTRLLDGPDVCNLGVPLGDVVVSENTLEQLLQRNVRPKLILLEVSPEFLSADNRWLEFHVDRQLRWDHLPRFAADLWRTGQGGKWLEERLLPWYVHRKGYWNAWGDLINLKLQAWRGRHKTLTAAERRAEWERTLDLPGRSRAEIGNSRVETFLNTLRPALHPADHAYHPGGGTLRGLERLLTRCRREQIDVLLIAPPLRSDHRALYTPEVEQTFLTCLRRLTTSFHISFWDARTVLPDHQFLDNQHADMDGARAFTGQLCNEPLFLQHIRRGRPVLEDAPVSLSPR